jgi:hypothetical protein
MMDIHIPEEREVVCVALGRPVQLRDLPCHSFVAWCDAVCYALVLAWAFDSGGALRAQRMLSSLQVRTTMVPTYPLDIRLFQARKDAMVFQAIVNGVLGPHRCFANAFAICAGLRRLGFSCHIVVGYEHIHQYIETPMDAYVEYEHEPISTTAEAQYSFVPMLIYGEGGKV